MDFAGTNYLAIPVAAIASFLFGWAWYGPLGERWMAALGKTRDELMPGGKPVYATMAISFVCELVMAWILAGLMGHVGLFGAVNGLITGAFVWAGFVATTLIVNHRYGRFPWALTFIDGGHWLGVLLVQGLVIGLFGV